MFSIKPSRRWQPAFYPFKKEKFGRRLLAKTELFVKGPLFGCRMCGNCLLQETAFICPMECPKGMRNGPCGGTTPAKNCYVDETRKCIWNCIYTQAKRLGREELLLEVLPPLDWEKVGTETWGEVAGLIRKTGTFKFIGDVLSEDKLKKSKTWDGVFKTIRQPEWWHAGAQFFQTNLVFDADRLDQWLEQLDKRNVLDKVFILIGVAPLKSFKVAEYLHTKVPGVSLPDNVLRRMEKAGESASEEGIQIALELIESIKMKKGVNGVHIMSMGWESVVSRLVIESGLKLKTALI